MSACANIGSAISLLFYVHKIDDIEKVEIVFKDGVGYDSQKLFDSVRGGYGQY